MSPTASKARRRLRSVLARHGRVIGSVLRVASQDCVVLTFDDGPDPVGTPAVLQVLSQHHATATFFVLMSRVRRDPGLVLETISAGHEIALHGPDHQPLPGLSFHEVLRRTTAARQELEDLTGQRVRWFRPPYGSETPANWLAVRRSRMVPVLWTGSAFDWVDMDQGDRVDRALNECLGGTILLAHDGFADASDGAIDDKAPMIDRADLMDRILTGLTARGLLGRSLGEALDQGPLIRRAQFRQLADRHLRRWDPRARESCQGWPTASGRASGRGG